MAENVSLGWEQEIIRVLQDTALRAGLNMTIKEVLKQIHDKQTTQRIVDFFKSKKIGNYNELIPIDLKSNPRFYLLLQGNIYLQYVRVDEGKRHSISR